MDQLPLHLQNKVLQAIEVDEEGNITRAAYKAKVKTQTKFHRPTIVKASFVMVFWAMPLTAIGLACIVTVILAPVGIALMVAGCGPLAKLLGRSLQVETVQKEIPKSQQKTS